MEISIVLSKQETRLALAKKVNATQENNLAVITQLNLIDSCFKLNSQVILSKCISHLALLLSIKLKSWTVFRLRLAASWFSILTQASLNLLKLFWAPWCSKTSTLIFTPRTKLQELIKY